MRSPASLALLLVLALLAQPAIGPFDIDTGASAEAGATHGCPHCDEMPEPCCDEDPATPAGCGKPGCEGCVLLTGGAPAILVDGPPCLRPGVRSGLPPPAVRVPARCPAPPLRPPDTA